MVSKEKKKNRFKKYQIYAVILNSSKHLESELSVNSYLGLREISIRSG